MNEAARNAIGWVEKGLVPDSIVRAGIRRLCQSRLAVIAADDSEVAPQTAENFAQSMDSSGIAPLPEFANEQHYDVVFSQKTM